MRRYSVFVLLALLFVSTASAQHWVEPAYSETYSDEEISRQLKEIVDGARTKLAPSDRIAPPPGEDPPLLPSRIDNSFTPHSRPVFGQRGGSCGSASRIGYLFAHETNAYRNLDGSKIENRYPSFFTWLLTSQGSEKEAMAMFNGIPDAITFGGDEVSDIFHEEKIKNLDWPTDANGAEYGWMQGYGRWKTAAGNRLERVVDLQLSSKEKIDYIKWWFYNHHGDESFQVGEILGGGVATSGWVESKIPAGSYRAGEKIITKFGPTIDHGVVWSGYDDAVAFDLNDDGVISDDEKGAIIMLNSWGKNWGNQGTIYIPYKLLLDDKRWAEFYYIRKDYRPSVMMKIEMTYSERSNLKLSIGIAPSADATEPTKVVPAHHFQFAGNSPIPMLGRWNDGKMHSEAMEFGFDLSDLSLGIDTREPFRYFLVVETAAGATGTGVVSDLSAVFYNYQGPGEKALYDSTLIASAEIPLEIAGGGKKILIPIDMVGDSTFRPDHIYIPQPRLSVDSFSSQQDNGSAAAANVLDGDPATIWHTKWTGETHPHQITVAIDSNYRVNGFGYLPRQTGGNNGVIGRYEIYLSMSQGELGTLVAEGEWANSKQVKYAFFEATEARYVTLRALSSANGDEFCSMAEFNLFAALALEPVTALESLSSQQKFSLEVMENRLQIANIQGRATLDLYTITGKRIFSAVGEGDGIIEFPLATSLISGIYIAKI